MNLANWSPSAPDRTNNIWQTGPARHQVLPDLCRFVGSIIGPWSLECSEPTDLANRSFSTGPDQQYFTDWSYQTPGLTGPLQVRWFTNRVWNVSRKCGYITCFGCPGEWPPCPPATSCYVLVQHAIRLEKICENARVSNIWYLWLLGIRPKPGNNSQK